MRKFLCIALAIVSCLPVIAQPKNGSAAKTSPKSMNQIIAEFCLKNTDPYELIKKWLKDNKGKNKVITPLAMDASCHDCHDPDQYKKDTAKINKWINESNQPEADYIRTLLSIQREWTLLGGGDNIVNSEIPKCFYEFSTDEFADMEAQLARRIYDRVADMARKNKKVPQYAFAGITYLLSVSRDLMLLGVLNSSDNSDISMAGEWLQTCYDQFDKRLFKEYQYQLYPTYLSLVRNLALLGVENNTGDIMEWMKKMDEFMHFKLKVDFEAKGHGDHGGTYHALVKGEVEVQCKLQDGGCYVWEPVNGNDMKFEVKEVIFQSDQGEATYAGPPTFSVPVALKVNMCADNPTLKLSFSSFGDPQETYNVSGGGTAQAQALYGLAMATLGSVNLDKMKSQANQLKDKAEQLKGHEGEIDAAAKRLRDHKNDPSYLNSAQGKSDMAMMNQMAKTMGYDPSTIRPDAKQMQNVDNLHAYAAALKSQEQKMSNPSYIGSPEYYKDQQDINKLKNKTDMNSLASSAGLDINVLAIEAPFQIGVKQVVDKTQRDKIKEVAGSSGGWEYGEFHVTLENMGH